jgi:flagellar basal-body rod protein FlgC
MASPVLTSLTALIAASAQVRNSASNIVNAQSVGTPKAAPSRAGAPGFASASSALVGQRAYQPVRSAQVGTSGGVKTVTRPARPATTLFYAPNHPAAGANGFIDAPATSLVREFTNIQRARQAYQASARVIDTARAIHNKLLDIN